MKKDPIDLLLQLAYLEGEITTHGLYEKTAGKRVAGRLADDASKGKLLQKLEAALESRSARNAPLTVGGLLRKLRKERALHAKEISSRLGISPNIYRMLERDRISPLKIRVEVWKKLRTLLQVSSDSLAGLIRRTHQLVWFRPSFRSTLARYDARKNKALKASTLQRAAEELYAKASLPLPPEEEQRLMELLKAIAS